MAANAEYFRDWISQPVSYVWPAYFLRPREALPPPRPVAPPAIRQEKQEEVRIEDVDPSVLESKEVDVTTIIMMPTPKKTPLSNDIVYENNSHDSDLYYELGVTRTTVQSKVSRIS